MSSYVKHPAGPTLPKILFSNTVLKDVPGPGETDLDSYIIPANTLNLDGQALNIVGLFDNPTGSGLTFTFYFNGVNITTTGSGDMGVLKFLINIYRLSSSTRIQFSTSESGPNGYTVESDDYITSGVNWTVNIPIKFTVTGGEGVQYAMYVTFAPSMNG